MKWPGHLEFEPRAVLLPEDKLEYVLLTQTYTEVDSLISTAQPGIAEERREYLIKTAPARNRDLVNQLQQLYGGQCQICLWDPQQTYEKEICHGHHIQWVSRGGDDELQNMVLICPNHHAAIHRCDAPFDYSDYSFVFRRHRERLRDNKHLE